VIAIATSRKHERECGSVSQSPRLEAVSVMAESVPLTANCLIKTDHSGDYALTWRLDDLDVHSNLGSLLNVVLHEEPHISVLAA
jgi:hypothetical protein